MSVRIEDPSIEHCFRGHKGIITGVAFDSTNKQIASSSEDKNIVLWNLSSNTSRCSVFSGHQDVVSSLQYSPNGHILATTSYDRTVRFWIPTISGKCTEFIAHTGPVRTLGFNNDGTQVSKN